MKLSELKTGESAVIVKVSGHGGFRKRVIEMGFIKGKKVDVLLNAPLQDPVKYKIMGYEVSLRHSEADHIEVVSIDEAKNDAKLSKAEEEDRQQVIDSKIVDSNDSDEQALGDKMLVAERKDNASNEALAEQEAERLHRVINVAVTPCFLAISFIRYSAILQAEVSISARCSYNFPLVSRLKYSTRLCSLKYRCRNRPYFERGGLFSTVRQG